MRIDGPNPCTKEDLPALIALVDSVMRAGSDQSMLTDYPLVYREGNLKNIQLIKAGGPVVAEVPFIPRTVVQGDCRFRIGIISPTATHPDHRHKGYGLACLNRCVRQMEQDGTELSVLWTLVGTFPFYEHGGYQAVRTQMTMYRCHRDDAQLFPDYGHAVIVYEPGSGKYLSEIQAMHEREAFGVLRSQEEYPFLLSLPKIKTLIALEGGSAIAYLMVSEAINKPGLIEAGGAKRGLDTLLHRARSETPNDKEVRAYSYLTPSVLGGVLERTLPERRRPWDDQMMIRINCVRGFLEKIKPWLERQRRKEQPSFSIEVSDAGELISLEFRGDGLRLEERRLPRHVSLSRRQLTSVIFGEHLERRVRVPAECRGLFPFYFPIWMPDHS